MERPFTLPERIIRYFLVAFSSMAWRPPSCSVLHIEDDTAWNGKNSLRIWSNQVQINVSNTVQAEFHHDMGYIYYLRGRVKNDHHDKRSDLHNQNGFLYFRMVPSAPGIPYFFQTDISLSICIICIVPYRIDDVSNALC